jgi:SpoVK/Ycf46/Vps4 family AAA+-type ATPase
VTKTDIEELVGRTKGYSGADLRNLMSETAMAPLRDVGDISKIENDTLRAIDMNDFKASLIKVNYF